MSQFKGPTGTIRQYEQARSIASHGRRLQFALRGDPTGTKVLLDVRVKSRWLIRDERRWYKDSFVGFPLKTGPRA